MVRLVEKRLSKLEQVTVGLRRRCVLKDHEGLYYGECGRGLSEEDFSTWLRQQDAGTETLVVVGWGLGRNVPAQHGSLALRVEGAKGAVQDA